MTLKGFTIGNLWRRDVLAGRGGLSLTVVWLCTGVFLAMLVLDLIHVVSWGKSISWLGISRAGLLNDHRLYQLVTAPLVHGGVVHLAFNMLALLMLGPEIEARLGRIPFAIFFVLCAWASLAGLLIFSTSPWDVGFGASGGIFGILVAQAIYFPNARVIVLGLFPLKMRAAAVVLAGMEFVLTMQGGRGAGANAGHLFGALAALPCLYLVHGAAFPIKNLFPRSHRQLKARPVKMHVRGEIPKEL